MLPKLLINLPCLSTDWVIVVSLTRKSGSFKSAEPSSGWGIGHILLPYSRWDGVSSSGSVTSEDMYVRGLSFNMVSISVTTVSS